MSEAPPPSEAEGSSTQPERPDMTTKLSAATLTRLGLPTEDDEEEPPNPEIEDSTKAHVPGELPFELPSLDLEKASHAPKPCLLTDGPPIFFNKYWGMPPNSIVAGSKRSPLYYHLFFKPNLKGWLLTLRRQTKEGPVACSIRRYYGLGMKYTFTFPGGWTTKFSKPTGGHHFRARSFRGFDGHTVYTWAPDSKWGHSWSCVLEGGETVATWRGVIALKKHGQLLIHPKYKDECELFLATIIAIDEYGRHGGG